jgi:hypothetical protein
MELLAVQNIKAVVTVYLSPVELPAEELKLLCALASASQSEGHRTDGTLGRAGSVQKINVAAAMAGEIYASQLRRLWPNAFLCLGQVAVENQEFEVARSLIATLSACVMEASAVRSDVSGGFPVGLSPCLDLDDSGSSQENIDLYRELDLKGVCPPEIDVRMQMLCDARGAATLFRFPVSIRGGVPGIEVRQFPPDYHDGPIRESVPSKPRSIILGRYSSGGLACLPVDHLTRHALIVGFTGSGKTVTALRILHQLIVDHGVPWLVLESAKQEYRGLCRVEAILACGQNIRVYTLGNSNCVPFRLNPFELIEGVRVEAHISKLQVCFEAAIPPVGPSSSVIFEALCLVYEKHGWSLDSVNDPGVRRDRDFPTLKSFVQTVSTVISERGYAGEVLSNVEAALIGRFKPLLMGSKGAMFDTQISDPPPEVLFEEPTVLEMNDLNLDDKAMTVMFILTLLREYREVHKRSGKGLRHITLVEEAHNILEEVGSNSGSETMADTRSKAVAAFCSMLAEIRSLGEGIIIADQSPQKLARDAIRNTNLQIAHQLRDGNDRETVATAMIMDRDQIDFLGKLEVGHAAVFWTGREKAGFLKADPYYDGMDPLGRGFAKDLEDTELGEYMESHFGTGDPTKWIEWYLLLNPSERRKQGLSLSDFWDWAARLAIDQSGAAPPLDETSAWRRFVANWDRLTRKAGVSGSGRELRDVHRRHFREAFSRVSSLKNS